MGVNKKLKSLFFGGKEDFVPILSKQVDYILRASKLLRDMVNTSEKAAWARIEKEIKLCEVQGDALLTEFHDLLSKRFFVLVNKLDLQAVAMALDDCLDVIKDTSKAVLIYDPSHLDTQLVDLANLAYSQSLALHEMIPLLSDIKNNLSKISLVCERVTELEHIADEDYENYIGYIFEKVDDVKELIKFKNLAEMLENATDAHKRISDNVRKLLLNYLSD